MSMYCFSNQKKIRIIFKICSFYPTEYYKFLMKFFKMMLGKTCNHLGKYFTEKVE